MERKRLVGAGAVPAHARPHRQERNLHAHRAGAGGGDRRGHSRIPSHEARCSAAPRLWHCLALGRQRSSKPCAAIPQEQAGSGDRALSEAGSSPVEYLRAIEKHLAKYPDSPRKPELERAAVRAAMEANDDRRIVLYGERVLARQPDDLQILERVTRSLLAAGSRDDSARAPEIRAALRGTDRRQMRKSRGSAATPNWQNQTDRGIAPRAALEARATGSLGQPRGGPGAGPPRLRDLPERRSGARNRALAGEARQERRSRARPGRRVHHPGSRCHR